MGRDPDKLSCNWIISYDKQAVAVGKQNGIIIRFWETSHLLLP